MGFPALPTFTVEPSTCWLCEHFQSYYQPPDQNGGGRAPRPTIICEGECRKYPPKCYVDEPSYALFEVPSVESAQQMVFGFCAWMPFAPFQWCSGFQRSISLVLPTPPTDQGDCVPEGPNALIKPWQFNVALGTLLWTKRPYSESCWTCQHFQRQREVPDQQSDKCSGYCCIEPNEGYASGSAILDKEYIPFARTIFYAPYMWCSRWEKTIRTIPEIPGIDDPQGPCFTSAPP